MKLITVSVYPVSGTSTDQYNRIEAKGEHHFRGENIPISPRDIDIHRD